MLKTFFLSLLIILSGCTSTSNINSFEECVAAGNPVMESYPRQCNAGGKTFTEEIETCLGMSMEQALLNARESECASEGELTNNYVCNENTGTIWIDLIVEDAEGCSPACVVDVKTGEVNINWRCTGLMIPENVCNTTELLDGENNSYKVVSIGEQCWTAENLNTGMMISSSKTPNSSNNITEKWCYNNDEDFCEADGGLYSWSEAQNICPDGWHLPTDEEYKVLEIGMGMTREEADDEEEILHRGTYQGTKLRINGSSGFNARMTGFMHENKRFYGHGELTRNDQTYFWTSTESNDTAWVRGLSDNPTVRRQLMNKDSGLSVRCLKN